MSRGLGGGEECRGEVEEITGLVVRDMDDIYKDLKGPAVSTVTPLTYVSS